jgi:peptidoglycan/xylan/chitin deacetylase (PgdA/CDA1 family)
VISLLASSAVGLIGSAAVYYSPYAWRLHCVNVLRKRAARDRILILTYDDGPSRSTTPAILQLLRRHNAKATFFMLGRSAQQNASIVEHVVDDGHDVGCHSDRHLNAWKVNPWAAVADISAGYEKLADWVSPTGLYRPPFGKMTLPTSYAIQRRGACVGWWTIDSGDTRSQLPQPRQVADRLAHEGGGIILMHDLDRSSDRNDFVLETTALLLDVAKRESFNIKRLSDLCP